MVRAMVAGRSNGRTDTRGHRRRRRRRSPFFARWSYVITSSVRPLSVSGRPADRPADPRLLALGRIEPVSQSVSPTPNELSFVRSLALSPLARSLAQRTDGRTAVRPMSAQPPAPVLPSVRRPRSPTAPPAAKRRLLTFGLLRQGSRLSACKTHRVDTLIIGYEFGESTRSPNSAYFISLCVIRNCHAPCCFSVEMASTESQERARSE